MTDPILSPLLHRVEKLPRIEIQLAGKHRHALPRMVQANEAWVSDDRTIELELQTQDGQIVVLPLDGYAMQNLYELIGQHLALKNRLAGS